jgi:DNA-nicking Smr family endonuclease
MKDRQRAPRGLAPDDRNLWEEIKRTIKPLRGRKTEIPAADDDEPRPARRTPAKAPPTPFEQKRAIKPPPPLAQLDRRTRSRVARGRVEIDARLDLHGLTLERARTRLAAFLSSAQSRSDGLVLVITGKGSTGGRGQGTGALRREVPHWLSLPEFRSIVIGFEEAAQGHGGAGALYVRIRRRRT